MRAAQVIDSQADLLHRLDHVDSFRAYISGVMVPWQNNAERLPSSDRLRDGLQVAVRAAYAYRVAGDMSLVAQHMASQLDDTDRWDRDLAPSRIGFMRLEHPLAMTDVRGKRMLINWVVWGPIAVEDERTGRRGGATALYFFNDHETDPDEVATDLIDKVGADRWREFHRTAGRWGFMGAEVVMDDQPLGNPTLRMSTQETFDLLTQGVQAHEVTNLRRLVHAIWLLMGQTITDVEPEHVERTAQKRAMRAGIPPRVTVVRLRRTEARKGDGETLVEWSHRWLVRGHTRWQPYGERVGDHKHNYGPQVAEAGRAIRYCTIPTCPARVERIYIAGFVKGPTDRPLRITTHVYDLAR